MCRVQGTAGGGNLRLAEVAWPAQGQVAARMQGQGEAGGGPALSPAAPASRGVGWSGLAPVLAAACPAAGQARRGNNAASIP